MSGRQRILPVRREYNRWVANQTLEDYALRFTAKRARRWSAGRVAQTAIGAISFLALEAIGGAITLSYGFTNAVAAILAVSVVILLTGIPIARYAARYGVDIDLLTRGAGFGYIGSTITSLIYATFTFMLFAIEASIMSSALELCFGIPLWLGYIISSLAVIPLVTHGITGISRFQLWTQPVWIVLNILPFVFIAIHDWPAIQAWTAFGGAPGHPTATPSATFDLLHFGAAAAVILALIPQIGEQVDFLRFLPPREYDREAPRTGRGWSAALLFAGPGWIILGAPKLLAGSFLAYLALRAGVPEDHAAEPAQMFHVAFGYVFSSSGVVLAVTAGFVVVSQLKINVMNAYAGSLAWSNFFSRLTHSHPGRVVWLVFNVAIALMLMELGIYRALERTLGVFSIAAVAWLGVMVADLVINKPLGLSPPGIEFKRAHLYDVNPVGVGGMGLAALVALVALFGVFGPVAQALAPFIALVVALVATPAIAWATGGRYYLARKPRAHWQNRTEIRCSVCEHHFEPEDMAFCPAYSGPICSLCCSLDARCHDLCKPKARFQAQAISALSTVLPEHVVARFNSRIGQYAWVMALFALVIGGLLVIIYTVVTSTGEVHGDIVGRTLWAAFFILMIIAGISGWFFVLANESRRVAQEESMRQNTLLLREIAAHRRTDAALQKAKEIAEAANLAKSRYVVGLSHELRTPLNAVLGYAQILERDPAFPPRRIGGLQSIRRNAEHLSGLIDGLLDISKIEAGRLQIQRNEVRIGEFLEQLVDMFRLQARAKGLDFRFEAARLPEVVVTDEKRLRQILINLLSNAIKFTERGHVALKVGYRNQVATIAVEDSGPGIPPDEIERVFEPFERGHDATVRAAAGLGLGLTITKLLTELMGGDISVSSTVGEGSRFQARLMLSAVARPKPAPAPAKQIRDYEGPRRTVLVVDDDDDHRDLIHEALEPIGFLVLDAVDGPACLDLVSEIRPDLFLLDISMPGMTGWELARHLRRRGHTAPIVMLSANIGDTPPDAGEHAVHNETLPKPFDLRQLLERIQVLLDLVWIDADETGPTRDEAKEGSVAGAPPPAPAAPGTPGPRAGDVAELLGLARIGYVRGIEAKLAALEGDGVDPAFIDETRRHMNAFDFDRMTRMLEGLADHG
ncbi:Signal transduction histidine kinase [Pseudoxanthobacter soli DSM 19599]|uniref:histidine kinase n=1 Tax=Pseudoxanthobacter soli DSM 19599 TaxID=1123029 RepID=A0A1M7ZRK9_9HYPH|nr:ATP-binding protein [Pseudoxanthobacter soli]SHO67543.1 Signal transduction histidine kinase [Pseudoxanthobacter soli DSM 19599]